MIKALLSLAFSVAFAIAMPAPSYNYVWNPNAMNTQGNLGMYQYSQTIPGTQGDGPATCRMAL